MILAVLISIVTLAASVGLWLICTMIFGSIIGMGQELETPTLAGVIFGIIVALLWIAGGIWFVIAGQVELWTRILA